MEALGDQLAVPVCSRQGREYVLGVLHAVARPGKALTPDDERLLGVLAVQLAFVVERRAGAQELQVEDACVCWALVPLGPCVC